MEQNHDGRCSIKYGLLNEIILLKPIYWLNLFSPAIFIVYMLAMVRSGLGSKILLSNVLQIAIPM